jgi:hypothetical protein
LGILRVLSEQTLQINKEVKDSSDPDPSLAKVVKDSTLTILHSFRSVCSNDLWSQAAILRVSAGLGRTTKEREARFSSRTVDLE